MMARPCVRKHCFQRDGLSHGDYHCLKLLSAYATSCSQMAVSKKLEKDVWLPGMRISAAIV